MKIKTDVSVHVPDWQYCNLQNYQDKRYRTNTYCRFCKKCGKHYECALFNAILPAADDLVYKCNTCLCPPRNMVITDNAPDGNFAMTFEDCKKQKKKLLKTLIKDIRKNQKTMGLAKAVTYSFECADKAISASRF